MPGSKAGGMLGTMSWRFNHLDGGVGRRSLAPKML